jgi:hypothetical protein
MARVIQIRNVPEALHHGLKARAATVGMSLSDYLLGELQELAVPRLRSSASVCTSAGLYLQL